MKKLYSLIVCTTILFSVFLTGCVSSGDTQNNVTADKDIVKMRNEYKINVLVFSSEDSESNDDLALYNSVPYFNVFDSMFIDYKNSDYEPKIIKKLIKKYKKTFRKASDNSDYYISDYKDGVCINQYVGKEKDVVIPETLDGKKVIKIGAYISYDWELGSDYNSPFNEYKINSITIPKTVKEVSFGALNCYRCEGDDHIYYLKNIYVDSENPYYTSVKGILYNKDKTCLLQIPMNYQNKTIDILEGTKAVYCVNAHTTETVNIPASVVSFGETINKYGNYKMSLNYGHYTSPLRFEEVKEVSEFNVDNDNEYYSSLDGVLYDKEKTILIVYPQSSETENFVVPDSVTVIGDATSFTSYYTEKYGHLKTIEIGKNVKKIYSSCGQRYPQKLMVKGYKNTAAEEYVKEEKKTFNMGDDQLVFVYLD